VDSNSFTIDIVDGCATPTTSDTTADSSVVITSNHNHLYVNAVSHFGIIQNHGVYYTSTADVPVNHIAYFDVVTRSLIAIGDL
jgi:hypothetical protein